MYMWIGLNVNPEWVQQVFGVQSAAQIDIDQVLDAHTYIYLNMKKNTGLSVWCAWILF